MLKTRLQAQPLANAGDQHIDRHRDPDLRLHGILAGAIESLDAQVLLDPPKEQFHLPACLVDLGDRQRRQREVVRQEPEPLAGGAIEIVHAPQRIGIDLGGLESSQNDGVIGSHAAGFVHRVRVASLDQYVGFGAHDEESCAERKQVEALEIHVAAVHDVERSRLRQNFVEDVHVVHFAVGNADKRGNVAVQVAQRVHLDGGLALAKLGPGKQ